MVTPQEDFHPSFLLLLPFKGLWLPFVSYLDFKVFSSCWTLSLSPLCHVLFGVCRDSLFLFYVLGIPHRRCNELIPAASVGTVYSTLQPNHVWQVNRFLICFSVFPFTAFVAPPPPPKKRNPPLSFPLYVSHHHLCFFFHTKMEFYRMTCKRREFYCTKMRSLERPHCSGGLSAGAKAFE